MRIFDFPILYGDKNILDKKEQIVISQSMAEKYFDDENPLGQRVSIKFSNFEVKSFFIGAVLDEFPKNTSIAFNVLVSMDNFFDLKFNPKNS